MIVVVVLVVGGGFNFDWLLVVVLVCGYGFFVLRLILSGLVNWVCLDLEKNMKNEVCGGIFCFKETHVYS